MLVDLSRNEAISYRQQDPSCWQYLRARSLLLCSLLVQPPECGKESGVRESSSRCFLVACFSDRHDWFTVEKVTTTGRRAKKGRPRRTFYIFRSLRKIQHIWILEIRSCFCAASSHAHLTWVLCSPPTPTTLQGNKAARPPLSPPRSVRVCMRCLCLSRLSPAYE